ncbi:tetraacyldisaccharide 4'-kinase [Hyphococcus sp.]|uniref:tetraacyldisaccharide 4'-kinase n=1 Tax=Hyphococcus sp. TaxID=2038636 RepID=UPI003CCC0F86
MREPWFWRSQSLTARMITGALTPLAALYQAGHQFRRRLASPARVDAPVLCIGNATLGGVGKTPFAIMLEAVLRADGVRAFFLTRGYGGALKGPVAVDANMHSADDVGDEALLLARRAPTIVSPDRAAGAALAVAQGAQAIIMDDGFQNPSLAKDISILLIAADTEKVREKTFPAGPYRERLDDAKKRADIIVRIIPAKPAIEKSAGGFAAWLEPVGEIHPQRVVAFAGLGRPERFFDMLAARGFDVAARFAFPDHHRFDARELKTLAASAARCKAALITTEKDFVRLPDAYQDDIEVFPVEMRINNPDAFRREITARIAALPKSVKIGDHG